MDIVNPADLLLRFGAAGPVPFARKTWDNPIRYPLNRAYGSEFELPTLAALKRRVGLHSVNDADLAFPGGSAVEWYPSSQGSSLLFPVPAGDFEAVLEMSGGTTGMMFGLGLLNASGAGVGFSPYDDGNAYTWGISGWGYSGTGTSISNGLTFDTRHFWVLLRKSGTNVTGRLSNTGSSFSSTTGARAIGVTPAYLTISRFYSRGPAWVTLHRFNVYPAPTFFPG